jgi:hypothetical protein
VVRAVKYGSDDVGEGSSLYFHSRMLEQSTSRWIHRKKSFVKFPDSFTTKFLFEELPFVMFFKNLVTGVRTQKGA